jgi:hypothetical protein
MTADFTNARLLIKLNSTDTDYTEFKFLTSFETKNVDNSNSVETSSGTVQTGSSSTGSQIKIENIELPDNLKHAQEQHRIVVQGRAGFYEAKFVGNANTNTTDETVVETWLMRMGTFLADDKWSPKDKMTRSATINVGQVIKSINGYDGTTDLD